MSRLNGWWRLWVVCSGLGLVFTTIVMVSTWPNKPPNVFPGYTDKLSEESHKLLLGLPYGLLDNIDKSQPSTAKTDDFVKPWTKYQKTEQEKGRDLSAELFPEEKRIIPTYYDKFYAPDGHEYNLVHHTTLEQLNYLQADYARVQRELLKRERIQHFVSYIGAWLLSSLVVVILWLSFKWVVTGFKQKN